MAMEFSSDVWPDWCPGCGNFGIFTALKQALKEAGVEKEKFILVSGIGCSGKIAHFVNVSGVHTLHGRAIPFATGIKASNPSLHVMVHGGDGDLLGIGMGHFVALGRRNAEILVVVHNNGVYGLTKGQASPTLALGTKTKSQAFPNINQAVNPILLGMAAGYTFLARGYAYNIEHLKRLFVEGLSHKGSGILEIIQPCVTWNNIVTMDWVAKNTYYLKDWDPLLNDLGQANEKKKRIMDLENGEKKALGIFLKDLTKKTHAEMVASINKAYLEHPPAEQGLLTNGEIPKLDINRVLQKYSL